MQIAITGASGLIGTALTAALRSDGHTVKRLVRRIPQAPDEVRWDPAKRRIDHTGLKGTDAIVHLAGAGVGDHRWTAAYKAEIRNSRVFGTATIARAAAELGVRVLVSASGIGYYGDRGVAELDESATRGTGFLADVVADWEAAADPARAAGVRVVHNRTGLVVAGTGGAWGRMIPMFRWGLGGRLGTGAQYWSYISLRDQIRATQFVLFESDLAGAVNVTTPHPVTNRVATAALARQLHRPALAPAPTFALKLALGEFSTEVLSSSRVIPRRLSEAGFRWLDPTIDDAVSFALGQRQ